MAKDLFRLDGKTALVTGSSRGIGLALAKGLAQYGADVAISARHEEELAQAKKEIETDTGRKVWTFVVDMLETAKLDDFFQKVVETTGGVDILLNNAGMNAQSPAEEFPYEVWQNILGVNLNAVFVLSQAFCRHRKLVGQGGKIVNTGSLMSHMVRPKNPPYAASKGGILMLTKALGAEWAKYGITVNAIGPGFFKTKMTRHVSSDETFNKWMLARTPMNRWGEPEELVGAAVFLSSEASSFVTGQIVYVDGGILALL
jgi:gluconate 5-dehydrogenase